MLEAESLAGVPSGGDLWGARSSGAVKREAEWGNCELSWAAPARAESTPLPSRNTAVWLLKPPAVSGPAVPVAAGPTSTSAAFWAVCAGTFTLSPGQRLTPALVSAWPYQEFTQRTEKSREKKEKMFSSLPLPPLPQKVNFHPGSLWCQMSSLESAPRDQS